MKIQINDSYYISDITTSDKAAYLEHFKEKQIYDQTLAIPFPYSEADAEWWINHCIQDVAKQGGRTVNWAIRRSSDNFLIGGIGFIGFTIGENHKAELGYWLAKPYWNNGIMTDAVRKVIEFGFNEFGLIRITANVFHFNFGSARVLEKAGFQFEANLRRHYKKDGQIFDGKLYAVIADEESNPRRVEVTEESSGKPIVLKPIGFVQSARREAVDDKWDSVEACILLDKNHFSTESVSGLERFSHVEILFHMNQVSNSDVILGARHPRGNPDWDKVGIFAQRAKNRPNRLGSTICRILRIEGLLIHLEGLDAIHGTPVLDIKPYMNEFAPRGETYQPRWASELMKDYWK